MREHIGLYRGKRTDNGEWVEGYLVIADGRINDGRCYILLTASDFSYGDNGNRIRIGCFVEVDPETVGECTDLEDKHGKLIFEGDIINGYSPTGINDFRNGVVKWSELFCAWHADDCKSLYKSCVDVYEIIGNIHDNPELLKGD